MKIGINARFLAYPYTGIGKYTHNLLLALAKMDPMNEYFLFTPKLANISLPENFKQIRIPEADLPSESLKKAHWEHRLVPEEMRKWDVNLAHFLYPANPNRRLKIPTIVTIHDAIPWRLKDYNSKLRSKLYHFNVKQALKKADHLITVSHFSMNEVKSILSVDENRVTVIPLAAPFMKSAAIPHNLDLRRKYLLYVGGYDPRKNVPTLMIAYQKFVANHYPIDLILVNGKGRGLEEYLTDEFAEKVAGRFPVRPKGKIIFTGPLSDPELSALYNKAFALVHPSVYEGFNLPLVEAMNYGLPMVIADIPVNHEVAGEAAYFVDPTDENTFGLGLHAFLNDPGTHASLAQRALLRKNDFDWGKTAEKTMEVYNLFL